MSTSSPAAFHIRSLDFHRDFMVVRVFSGPSVSSLKAVSYLRIENLRIVHRLQQPSKQAVSKFLEQLGSAALPCQISLLLCNPPAPGGLPG